MTRAENLYAMITLETFIRASDRAAKGHEKKREVVAFMISQEHNCEWLYNEFQTGGYIKLLRYSQLSKINPNGKQRDIDSPDFITRIFQYVFLEIIEPLYNRVDPMLGINCKPGCGITSNNKEGSVVHRLKHVFYDCRQYSVAVVADQRKCYAHIKISVFRRMLRRLVHDTKFVDFAVNVCFVNGHLPIGTPTSPLVHHILMLPFDMWIKKSHPDAIRYADDNFVPCQTKEEAQQVKWRIKNYWWYVLQIRAKRQTVRVTRLDKKLDFCGYIPHRISNKRICNHNKGYTTVRNNTFVKAKNSNVSNWPSYFGILRHADVYAQMLKIEASNMDLRKLTRKIKITRNGIDAQNITVKELADEEIVFTVYDYELREDNKGKPNWIKCLIGIPEYDEDDKPTGTILAREFHGGYQSLVDFHVALEKNYDKNDILPLTNCEVVNSCGYIYKGSTNQLKYIQE